MTSPLSIMVIEDYDLLREAIVDVLTSDGHQVVGVAMAEDVDDEPTGFIPDLYIIDLNLPGEDGIALARRIHCGQPDAIIIIASARNRIEDRVTGYEAGANIYMTKPLALDELRAAISSLSRRQKEKMSAQEDTAFMDSVTMELHGPAGHTRLTQPELLLLGAFARAHQQRLEHWQVAEHLGEGKEISKDNVEVKLGRLRKKLVACGLEASTIRVLRGYGYKLCTRISVNAGVHQ